MKIIKKVILLMAVVMMLVSCSNSNSPTSAVDKELKELQKTCIEQFTSEISDENSTKQEKDVLDQLGKMLGKQSYKLDNEVISGDSATVDVHFKTYDFMTSFQAVLSEYISQALSGSSELTSEDAENLLYEIWLKHLQELEKQGMSKDFDYTFELSKTDKGWEVTNGDSMELMDGFFGGLISGLAG